MEAFVVRLLDMRGPSFLTWYGGMAVLLFVLGPVLRSILRLSFSRSLSSVSAERFSAAESGYLAGGPVRAVQAILVALSASGQVRCSNSLFSRVWAPSTSPVSPTHRIDAALERRILAKLSSPRTVKILVRECQEDLALIEESLVDQGLVHSRFQRWLLWLTPLLPLVALLVLGGAKVSVGWERQRPVGFLLAEMAVVLLVTVVLAYWTVFRSRTGDRMLGQIKDHRSTLAYAVRQPIPALNPADLAMAVAVFGAVGLPALGYADLAGPLGLVRPNQRPDQRDSGASSCHTSTCAGGGGGDSGGSSCGGDGGGGCGGCGGGD